MKTNLRGASNLVLCIILNVCLADAQSYPWADYSQRSQAEVSKSGLLPMQKLLSSPQKVDVNATGNFNLSLPILTVPGRGGLNFDLTLNYTPGIKVTDEASWVGLGWNLDVGSIIRNVIGSMDHTIHTISYTDPVTLQTGLLDNPVRDTYSISCPAGNGKLLQFPNPSDPSHYMFQLEEWKPWIVTYDTISHSFRNVTEDGTTYIFGEGAPGASSNSGLNTNSPGYKMLDLPFYDPFMQWHLTDIKSPSGQNWIKIYWSYDATTEFKKIFYRSWSSSSSHTGDEISLTSMIYPAYIETPTYVAVFESIEEPSNPIRDLLVAQRDGISWLNRGWDTYFEVGAGTSAKKRRLASIKLYRRTTSSPTMPPPYSNPTLNLGTPVQTITFNYKDPNAPMTYGYIENRSILNSVTITSSDPALPAYTYSFSYHDIIGGVNPFKAYSWWSTPGPYVGAMFEPDHSRIGFLGWYNDTTLSLGLSNYFMGSWDDGKMWNLSRITYPSGGYIDFDYTSNRYVMDFSYKGDITTKVWGAGSRLVKQTIFDGFLQNMYTYEYGTNLINGTFISGIGRMYAEPLEFMGAYPYSGVIYPPSSGTAGDSRIWNFHQTTHQVLYQQIIETRGDGSKVRSTYNVFNLDDHINPLLSYTAQTIFQNTIGKRGSLVKREYLNSTGSTVKTEVYNKTEEMKYSDVSTYNQSLSYWKSSDGCTETLDGVVSSSGNNYCPENGSIRTTTETNSDGKKRYTHYRYPTDYSISDQTILMLLNANIVNPVLATWIEDGSNVFSANVIAYYLYVFPHPYQLFALNNPLPINGTNYLETENYDDLLNIDQRDGRFKRGKKFLTYEYDNLTLSTDAKGTPTTFIWSYNSSVPIASVKNATSGNVAVSVFDDGDISNWDGGSMWYNTGGIYTSDMYAAQWTSPNKNNSTALTDAIPEADIRFNNMGRYRLAGLMKYVDGTHYVRFELRKSDNLLRIECCNGGAPYHQDIAFTFAENQWYHLKGVLVGSTASLYLNGKLMISFTNSNAAIAAGKIGLSTDSTSASFDNVRFYPVGALAQSNSYDPTKLLINRLVDENMNSIEFGYDALGRVKSKIGPTPNRDTLLAYSYPNLITTDINVYQNPTPQGFKGYSTDFFGRPKTQEIQYDSVNPHIVTDQEYDASGRLWLDYKPSGIPKEYKYYVDPLDRLKKQGINLSGTWQINGTHSIQYNYGTNGIGDVYNSSANTLFKTSVTDENGIVNTAYKDIFGNTIQTVNNDVSPLDVDDPRSQDITTKFQYDILGRCTQSTAPNGLVSNYTYNTIGQITQKTAPDAGTTQYLYDKNGNVRFIKDANHTGSANNVPVGGTVQFPNSVNGPITLTMPGKLIMTGSITSSKLAHFRLKANGTIIKDLYLGYYGAFNQSVTLILPKGSYTYEIIFDANMTGASVTYSITSNTNYEFVYNKYDKFNRVTETGEYLSTGVISFTQANADNSSFACAPDLSDRLVLNTFTYDEPSTDAVAAGQRNLQGKLSHAESYQLGNITATNFYSYNEFGRVEWKVQKTPSITAGKQIKYDYDLQGRITRKSYIDPTSSTRNLYTFYNYDQAGRLLRVSTDTDPYGATKTKEAEYLSYNNNSQVTQCNLGSTPAQTITYTYESDQDWLRTISSAKYMETIGYNTTDEIGNIGSPKQQYNGNISWLMYSMVGLDANPVGWKYSYDNAKRLIKSDFGYKNNGSWSLSNNFSEPAYTYDASGNILALQRNGKDGTLMDNLTYNYNYQQTPSIFTLNPDSDVTHDAVWVTTPANSSVFECLNDGGTPNESDYVLANFTDNSTHVFEVGFQTINQNQKINLDANVLNLSIRYYSMYNSSLIVRLFAGSEEIQPLCNPPVICNSLAVTGGPLVTSVLQYNLNDLHSNNLRVRVEGNINDGSLFTAAVFWIKLDVPVLTISGSNQLTSITDSAPISAYAGDVENQQSNNYAYDANGNTIKDVGSNIGFIQYDITNRPIFTYLTNGTQIVYYYDADGNLVQKSDGAVEHYIVGIDGKTEVTMPSATSTTPTYYVYGNNNVGMIKRNGSTLTRYYYLKDHLGSTKMTIDATGNAVVAYEDCYPLGMTMENRSMTNVDPKWRFTGKEKSASTGHYLFGARTYNPQTGRWDQVDPLAENYMNMNPYNYCANNPIRFIDKDGREITVSKAIQPDGTVVYKIHYTATVVNNSGEMIKPDVLQHVANAICNQIEESFSGSSIDGKVKWSATADIVIGDAPRVGDNTISIENLLPTDNGKSEICGPTQKINSSLVVKGDFKQISRTGGHEFGHGAGLDHLKDETGKDILIDQKNLMQQSIVSKGTKINKKQIEESNEVLKLHELARRKKQENETK